MAKSKFFRVATEGATTDGRVIKREWIEQAAANYDPAKFAARVNMEHLRGLYPDSTFRMYGDVLALEARDVEDGKKALFAQIDPTDDLVAMVNGARQKVFTSIEISQNFAGSGEAYMVGLAVTDNPASLGCEMLKFAAGAAANPLAGRKQAPENLFTEAVPITLEFETQDASDSAPSLIERFKAAIGKRNGALEAQLVECAGAIAELSDAAKADKETVATLSTRVNELAAQVTALTKAKSGAADDDEHFTPPPTRPAATGGTGAIVTDC